METTEPDRGLFGSIPQMGVTIGLLLGTFVMSLMTLMPDETFMSWGWRIPFLLSALLVVFGLWVRHGIDETPSFKKVQETGRVAKVPLMETLRSQWREVLIAVGGKVVETAPFYIFGTFIVSYATTNLGFSKTAALNAVTIATAVTTVLIPLMGKWSDRYGRKPLYIAGTVGMMIYAFPYFWLLQQKSVALLIIATVIGLGIIWAPITAVLGTMFSEIFPSNVRYTGISLGYQIGAALAGGTAPLIATALLAAYGNSYVPVALYIVLVSLISLAAVWSVRDRKHEELDEQDGIA